VLPVTTNSITLSEVKCYAASLERVVQVDIYHAAGLPTANSSLLILLDGQDLPAVHFNQWLTQAWRIDAYGPLVIAAIHAGSDRKMEYGVVGAPDYMGRGAKADLHALFIKDQLLQLLNDNLGINSFSSYSIAGFSLGGLTAFDLAWGQVLPFSRVGVFSGSLWWRSVDQDDPIYQDSKHRIIHQKVQQTICNNPQLRFFFQCGGLDENNDRNKNGIIDSIDDTVDLLHGLEQKGFIKGEHLAYLEIPTGKHNLETWLEAMPHFFEWGWSNKFRNA